jgi:mannose/fructose/N-acetylgalactosamine-specific phosphotransferase system component IIB
MELLTIISVIIGIIVGLLAILEKFFNIFSRKKKYQKILKDEFEIWKNNDYDYTMSLTTLNKVVGCVKNQKLDDEINTFVLLSAIQHGAKCLNKLINLNYNNKNAIRHTFNSVKGKGIRVGWRSEYVLTKLNPNNVREFLEKLPEEIKKDELIMDSIERIQNDNVELFLKKLASDDDKKLKSYANEVLNQIKVGKLLYEY